MSKDIKKYIRDGGKKSFIRMSRGESYIIGVDTVDSIPFLITLGSFVRGKKINDKNYEYFLILRCLQI